jgi:chorismate mutase/prephenate dehydratase
MELKDIRQKIDQIDDQIAKLYNERMHCVAEVIDAKKQTGKAVFDPDREKNIILRVADLVDDDKKVYLKRVFETLMDTSKAYQTVNSVYNTSLSKNLTEALDKGELVFPVKAKIACQGIKGAYSGIAADRLFELADITYFKNFEGVFNAVEKGFCRYGVLPIENRPQGLLIRFTTL